MIAKESRNEVALAKFLDANPDLREEIKDLSAKEQGQQVQWAFDDAAEEQGLDPWELVLNYVAETPEELRLMRREVHEEVAEALGMSWEEYRDLNEIQD